MEGFTEKEIQLLRKIVTDDAFELLKHVANTLYRSWTKNPINEETEFLTAKEAIKRAERKEALDLFFKSLEEIAHGR